MGILIQKLDFEIPRFGTGDLDGVNSFKITSLKDKLFVWENGELLQTINIKHKPIASTRIINTNWQSYGGYNNYVTPSQPSVYNQANLWEDEDWDTVEEEDYVKAEHLQKISQNLQELEEHLNLDIDSRQTLRNAIVALDEIANEIYYSY